MQGTIMDPMRYNTFYQDIHSPINLKDLTTR